MTRYTTGTNGSSVVWSETQAPLVEIVPLSDAGRRLVPTFAAAPQLLASLREFIEKYSAETSTGSPELERARDAIAKAEGRL